ncbi:MAG: sarcosine oxidase subunit delta [Rhodospirillaceae bacterium]|jgi:methylglutamate dehydrogenase subunit B|nr:sarcosine oxidase subunit delta [Rhodospirillaceae bacterium]
MLHITCPWCGPRAQTEFSYEDDATRTRPTIDDTNAEMHFDYVYQRDPRMGVQDELWRHGAGCGKFVKVRRNTLTHEITATGAPHDDFDGDAK